MTIALVQSVATAVGGTSTSVPSTTAGNLLTLTIDDFSGGAGCTFTVSDGVNTWTQAASQYGSGSNGTAAIFYAKNIAGGTISLSITDNLGSSFAGNIQEWSGCDTVNPLASHDTLNQSTNQTQQSGSASGISTSGPCVVILAGIAVNGGITDTPGTGYTALTYSGAAYNFAQYQIFSSAITNEKGDWTTSINQVTANVIAAFNAKAANAGSSTGTSSASALSAATGNSTGSATASATGAPYDTSIGSSTGAATATGVGGDTDTSTGSSTGTGIATGVGAPTVLSVGSSTGAATASAVALTGGIGTSTGTGTATGIGEANTLSIGASTGSATASGVSVPKDTGVGTAAGTSSANAVGSATTLSVGTATGVATASATGIDKDTSVGTTAGSSVVTGVGAAKFIGIASASGIGIANATGASKNKGTGAATGTATVIGFPTAAGVSAGTSSVSGIGESIIISDAIAAGISIVNGVVLFSTPSPRARTFTPPLLNNEFNATENCSFPANGKNTFNASGNI